MHLSVSATNGNGVTATESRRGRASRTRTTWLAEGAWCRFSSRCSTNQGTGEDGGSGCQPERTKRCGLPTPIRHNAVCNSSGKKIMHDDVKNYGPCAKHFDRFRAQEMEEVSIRTPRPSLSQKSAHRTNTGREWEANVSSERASAGVPWWDSFRGSWVLRIRRR